MMLIVGPYTSPVVDAARFVHGCGACLNPAAYAPARTVTDRDGDTFEVHRRLGREESGQVCSAQMYSLERLFLAVDR